MTITVHMFRETLFDDGGRLFFLEDLKDPDRRWPHWAWRECCRPPLPDQMWCVAPSAKNISRTLVWSAKISAKLPVPYSGFPELRIHGILVWIRIRIWIRGSMPLTNGSGSGFGFGSGSKMTALGVKRMLPATTPRPDVMWRTFS